MNYWALFLLWLAGINLRITVLSVPPLLPYIHEDLHLSAKAVGTLGGLPVIIFGLGALFGSLLLARTGVVRALIAGLALAGLAGALRGIGPDIAMLFAMTALMGLGIAIMQPCMPTLVAHWFPAQAGFATAVYVNGLLVGEVLAAAFSSRMADALGGWASALAAWSLFLVANIILLWMALKAGWVSRPGLRGQKQTGDWWPDWTNGRMLLCGAILGCAASLYFGSNVFIPDFLHATGRGGATDAALTSLNAAQLPASLLLMWQADRLVGRSLPLMVIGSIAALTILALAYSDSTTAAITLAGIIGACAAATLILVLALPPLMAPAHDVHRFSAGVFMIGYTVSCLTPILGGALWDATQVPQTAFFPIAGVGLILAMLALRLRLEPSTR